MKKIIFFLILTSITSLNAMKNITNKLAKINIKKFNKKTLTNSSLTLYKNSNIFNFKNLEKLQNHTFQIFPYMTDETIKIDTPSKSFKLTQISDGSFILDNGTHNETLCILHNRTEKEIMHYFEKIATDLLQLIVSDKAIETLDDLLKNTHATRIALEREYDKLHYQLFNNLLAKHIVWKMVGKNLTLDPISPIIAQYGPVPALLAGIGHSEGKNLITKFTKFMNESKKYLVNLGKTEYEIQKELTIVLTESKIEARAHRTIKDNENTSEVVKVNKALLFYINSNKNKEGLFEFKWQPV